MEAHELKSEDEKKHDAEKHGDGKHIITIFVNEQPVKFHVRTATGFTIKATAITEGVHIEPNFVLQEELPNGTSKIVGDNDEVQLREHLRFTAIRPDDNS